MRREIVRVGPLLIAAVVLAGCQSVNVQTVDQAIRKNLDKACVAVTLAHDSFQAINQAHPLKLAIVQTEQQAYDDARAYCDHPENANTMSAVIAVGRLGVTIYNALATAEKAGA